MGSIQDREVLLAMLDKFRRKQEGETASRDSLRVEIARQQATLVARYMARIDTLATFWKTRPAPGRILRNKR
jgi:hypothetical protein